MNHIRKHVIADHALQEAHALDDALFKDERLLLLMLMLHLVHISFPWQFVREEKFLWAAVVVRQDIHSSICYRSVFLQPSCASFSFSCSVLKPPTRTLRSPFRPFAFSYHPQITHRVFCFSINFTKLFLWIVYGHYKLIPNENRLYKKIQKNRLYAYHAVNGKNIINVLLLLTIPYTGIA